MITKDQLLDSMLHELTVSQHLIAKLKPEDFEYRPTEGQRSTKELLQYLSMIGDGSIDGMLAGNWDGYKAKKAIADALQPSELSEAFEREKETLRKRFASFTEEELLTKQVQAPGLPQPTALGHAMVLTTMKFLTAYKMQLFLYAKSLGHPLATSNVWRGVDPQPKP